MFKNILVLCFSENGGGMELDTIRFCRRLSTYTNVTLIAVNGSLIESMATDDRKCGFRYNFIGCSLNRFLARSLIDPRLVKVIRKEYKNNQYDLVIFYGTSEVKSIAIALLGLTARLVVRIGTTINRPKTNWFQRLFYSRVDAFLVTSEHIKSNIFQSFPVACRRPVEVCYPVILATDVISKTNEHLDNVNVVYHSRFARGKGQIDAVMAFNAIKRDHSFLNFLLVGSFEDEAYVEEIKSYIEEHNLSDQINILPSTKDVYSLLSKGHIFLAPSYGEGFSNSFAEAMSFGLVCVVYDNTALHYFRGLGFDYFMVPTGDIPALGIALSNAVNSLRNGLVDIKRNQELVSQLFSAEQEKLVLESLYHKLNPLD